MSSRILHRIRILAMTLLLLCGLFVTTSPAMASSFLWKVNSDTATVYLLGSIHLGVPSMYPLPKAMEDAYASADYLVVEVNESELKQPEVQLQILQKGMYQGDDTLVDHVDASLYQRLTTLLTKLNIPVQPIVKMRPGMIAITLDVLVMQQMGYSPELGVDMHFMHKAQKQHKPILELESAQEQMNLLLGFNDDTLLLKQTLIQLDNMKDMSSGMLSSWQNGNAEALNKLVIEDPLKQNPEFLPFTKKLIFDRNITMAKKIQQYLSDKSTYFVIVGAGHLVGDKGIISLLRKKGFHASQL